MSQADDFVPKLTRKMTTTCLEDIPHLTRKMTTTCLNCKPKPVYQLKRKITEEVLSIDTHFQNSYGYIMEK